MKPKSNDYNDVGLLEYLELIIGSYKFIEIITKLEKESEELSDKKNERVDKLKLQENDIELIEK